MPQTFNKLTVGHLIRPALFRTDLDQQPTMATQVFDRGNEPMFSDRPESQYYTEFEDDDSEVEQSSLKSSIRTVSNEVGTRG